MNGGACRFGRTPFFCPQSCHVAPGSILGGGRGLPYVRGFPVRPRPIPPDMGQICPRRSGHVGKRGGGAHDRFGGISTNISSDKVQMVSFSLYIFFFTYNNEKACQPWIEWKITSDSSSVSDCAGHPPIFMRAGALWDISRPCPDVLIE